MFSVAGIQCVDKFIYSDNTIATSVFPTYNITCRTSPIWNICLTHIEPCNFLKRWYMWGPEDIGLKQQYYQPLPSATLAGKFRSTISEGHKFPTAIPKKCMFSMSQGMTNV